MAEVAEALEKEKEQIAAIKEDLIKNDPNAKLSEEEEKEKFDKDVKKLEAAADRKTNKKELKKIVKLVEKDPENADLIEEEKKVKAKVQQDEQAAAIEQEEEDVKTEERIALQ